MLTIRTFVAFRRNGKINTLEVLPNHFKPEPSTEYVILRVNGPTLVTLRHIKADGRGDRTYTKNEVDILDSRFMIGGNWNYTCSNNDMVRELLAFMGIHIKPSSLDVA